MKEFLVINISSLDILYDDIEVLLNSLSDTTTNVVVYLPQLGSLCTRVINNLAYELGSIQQDISLLCFVEDKDFGNIPFSFLESLKEQYSDVHISSKECKRVIDDYEFSYFSCDEYFDSELEDFILDVRVPTLNSRVIAYKKDSDLAFLPEFIHSVGIDKVTVINQLSIMDKRNINNDVDIYDETKVKQLIKKSESSDLTQSNKKKK